jgi:hypothetical protein
MLHLEETSRQKFCNGSSFDNTLGTNVIEQNLYGETLDDSVNIKVSTKALDS